MIGKKDWNLLEIKIIGNNAKYIINGYVVNEFIDDQIYLTIGCI